MKHLSSINAGPASVIVVLSIAGAVALTGCSEKSAPNSEQSGTRIEAKQNATDAAATKPNAPENVLELKPSNGGERVAAGVQTPKNAMTTTTALVAAAEAAAATAESSATESAPESSERIAMLAPPETSAPAQVSTASAPAEPENLDLAQSPSPYLRSASKSPVLWKPFASATFLDAQKSGKPVLIDIGAQWSHACRTMASSVYTNPEVSNYLNEHFVCIKADCDLQPEIAVRYLAAYSLINRKSSDYPLTVFALPDGRPFDILNALPVKTTGGQAGVLDLAKQVVDLFAKQLPAAEKQADLIESKLAALSQAAADAKTPDSATMDSLAALAKTQLKKSADADHSSFAALFLLHHYSDKGDKDALNAASEALLQVFRSERRDNVLGGFFKAPEAGKDTQFAKLLSVQSRLLSANACAYAATQKKLHKEAAQDILRFCRDTIEANGGGFFTAQDADLDDNDNASYFTWSADEVIKIAGDSPQTNVFIQYFNVGDKKGPLYVSDKLQSAADANKLSYDDALKALNATRAKLSKARMAQEHVPFVNKAILASCNADMICAYLDAYNYLGDSQARDFALQTADLLITTMVSERQGVAHVLHKNVPSRYGLLADNVKLAMALLQCFQATGAHEYLESAESLLHYAEARFLDKATGLYRDCDTQAETGLLKVSYLPLEDDKAASSNAVAALAWYQLFQMSGKEDCLERAKRIASAAQAKGILDSIEGSTFGRVAELLKNGAPKALIIGNPDDPLTRQMREAALPVFRMGKVVEVLTPAEAAKTDYPPAKDGKPIAYVCTAQNCAPPVREAEKIAQLLKTFGRPAAAGGDSASAAPKAEAAGNGDSAGAETAKRSE